MQERIFPKVALCIGKPDAGMSQIGHTIQIGRNECFSIAINMATMKHETTFLPPILAHII